MANITPLEEQLLEFSTNLYGVLDKPGNVCASPYSLVTALLLLMIGARGPTKDQISSAVFKEKHIADNQKFQQLKDINEKLLSGITDGLQLNVANKLFVNKKFTLTKAVSTKAKNFFQGEIGYKDFSKPKISAIFMNRFIAKRTNNKIKDLIDWKWLNSMTAMVLVNAVYFKGEWKTKFDSTKTGKRDFFITKTRKIKVDMMNNKLPVHYQFNNDFSAIALPYKGDQYDMVFILPKEINGLPSLEAKLSLEFLKNIHSKFTVVSVKIAIPKFTFQTELNLQEVLPNLGISDMFSSAKADFSNLIQQKTANIYVSRAVHKVFIEVNEEGTEAAAATGIVPQIRSLGPTFTANHPFIFYIRHISSGIVLFIGRYSPS